MPKRSRQDSPISPTTSTSPSPTPDPSSPGSVDVPAHSSKYLHTSDKAPPRAAMKCSLPPHHDTLSFSTFDEFDLHYAKEHVHRCSDCRRNFPTEHFMGLHISENHDPLCEAMRAKGEKTYRCFVEDCDKVCSTPQKRQMHLIDKHMFPKASVDLLLHEILTIFKRYDFWIVNTGVDKRSSMLRSKHRKNSTAATRAIYREHCTGDAQASPSLSKIRPEALEQSPVNDSKATNSTTSSIPSQDADVDELASTMSALKFVPPSVRFGRGGRRGGLSGS